MIGAAVARTKPDKTGHSRSVHPDRTGHPPLGGVPVRPRGGRKPKGQNRPLSLAQAEALRKYSRETERAASTTRQQDERLDAALSVQAADKAMGPRCRAIVDLVVLRGQSVGEVATRAGMNRPELHDLLHEAATRLAAHYEQRLAANV